MGGTLLPCMHSINILILFSSIAMAIGVTESELVIGFVNRSAHSQNSNITPTTCHNILFLDIAS